MFSESSSHKFHECLQEDVVRSHLEGGGVSPLGGGGVQALSFDGSSLNAENIFVPTALWPVKEPRGPMGHSDVLRFVFYQGADVESSRAAARVPGLSLAPSIFQQLFKLHRCEHLSEYGARLKSVARFTETTRILRGLRTQDEGV